MLRMPVIRRLLNQLGETLNKLLPVLLLLCHAFKTSQLGLLLLSRLEQGIETQTKGVGNLELEAID